VGGESFRAMARGEAYAIVLADRERSELEHRAACYTLPHKRVQRAKLVLYAAEGLGRPATGILIAAAAMVLRSVALPPTPKLKAAGPAEVTVADRRHAGP
jgi:hypothetical protein